VIIRWRVSGSVSSKTLTTPRFPGYPPNGQETPPGWARRQSRHACRATDLHRLPRPRFAVTAVGEPALPHFAGILGTASRLRTIRCRKRGFRRSTAGTEPDDGAFGPRRRLLAYFPDGVGIIPGSISQGGASRVEKPPAVPPKTRSHSSTAGLQVGNGVDSVTRHRSPV